MYYMCRHTRVIAYNMYKPSVNKVFFYIIIVFLCVSPKVQINVIRQQNTTHVLLHVLELVQ